MDLTCPSCGYATAVPDTHVPPEGTRARCPSCARVSIYLRGGLVDDMPTPPQPMEAVTAQPAPAATGWPMVAAAAARPAGATTGPHAATKGAATGPHAAAMRWRFKTPAGEEGPYDHETVKNLVRTHTLHPDDEAQVEGSSEWRRAGDVPELSRYFKMRAAAPAAGAAAVATCFKHPTRPGKWHCTGCGTLTCDTCVSEQEMGRVKVKICPRCQKAATAYVPSKVIVPFWKELGDVFTFPLRNYAWIALIICSVLGVMADIGRAAPTYGTYVWGLIMLPVYTYHLLIIRSTSRGSRTLPNLGNIANYKEDLVKPGGKALFVTTVLFVGPYLLLGSWVIPAWGKAAASAIAVQEAIVERDRAEAEKANPRHDEEEESEDAPQYASADESSGSEQDQAFAAFMEQMQGQTGGGFNRRHYENLPETDWNKELANRRKELRSAKSAATTKTLILGVLFMAVLTVLPLCLIVVALFNTVAPVFQPHLLFRIIKEIQNEYAICCLFTITLALISLFVATPLIFKTHGLFRNDAWPLSYYFTFVAFYVMGRTAEMAEQKLDWA